MTIVRKLAAHWFYILLAVGLGAAWHLAGTAEAIAAPGTLERVFLFDFGVFLPFVYFLYLRTRNTLRVSIMRALALAGAGLAYAAYLMPEGSGAVLPTLAWLRYIALPLLILFELGALIAITKYAFGAEPEKEHLIKQGVPPLMAKMMLAEARFWKRIYSLIFGEKK